MKHQTPAAGELQRRFLGSASRPSVDTETRTCELSFSSSAPVERMFGIEVLSHAAGAADLSRLNNSAPLLFNHDPDDILGVVESASISGGKGRAVVRFGRDQRGDWAMRQAADGVLVNVSFSYRVTEYDEAPNGDLVALRWEALEVSLVTVPADKSVGIGRSITTKGRKTLMDEHQEERPSRSQRAQQTQHALSEQVRMAGDLERSRMLEIGAMGRRFGLPETTIVEMQRDGTSIEDARARTHEFTQRRQSQSRAVTSTDDDEVGLNDREVGEFSLVKAINAALTNDWSKAGLERSSSRAMETRYGRSTQGFYVPPEVMSRGSWSGKRTYQTSSSTGGASLVETALQPDQFIEVLRNSAMVAQAGATILSGLVGNVDIPRQIGQTPSYWVGESANLTYGEGTYDKISLRPKTIGAISKMSRLMLMQSTPAIEMMVRQDMIAGLGLGLDLASLSGSGSGSQPTGLASQAGVGSILLGTNGANITLDAMLALETLLNVSNAPMAGRAYMINPKTAGTLKNVKSSTGQYLWTDSPPGQRSATPHMFNGYPVFVTNQVRGNLTKGTSTGVCSELFFGAWPDVIIGQWGTLEIIANPFDAGNFPNGDVSIRALQTVDVGVRRPASFVTIADALTP